MSSYVNFYLKNGKTGAITYLFGYSGSSAIYEIFKEEFYVHQTKEGYCDELTVTDCERLIRESLNQRDKLHQVIASYEKSIKDLATWNNSVEEKMEYYSDWDRCIEQAKEDIEGYNHVVSFFSILKEMIEYNPDKAILLAGIDCYASREEEEADK
jgi:hypothetical protein